jgi:hypothetical protein
MQVDVVAYLTAGFSLRRVQAGCTSSVDAALRLTAKTTRREGRILREGGSPPLLGSNKLSFLLMIPIALQSGLGSSLGAGVRRVYFPPDLGGTLIEGVDAGEERRRSSHCRISHV